MCDIGLTPCCLLAFRNRLATQFLNQDDKIGIPVVLQGVLGCRMAGIMKMSSVLSLRVD